MSGNDTNRLSTNCNHALHRFKHLQPMTEAEYKRRLEAAKDIHERAQVAQEYRAASKNKATTAADQDAQAECDSEGCLMCGA